MIKVMHHCIKLSAATVHYYTVIIIIITTNVIYSTKIVNSN